MPNLVKLGADETEPGHITTWVNDLTPEKWKIVLAKFIHWIFIEKLQNFFRLNQSANKK